jgi:Transposase DDE domain
VAVRPAARFATTSTAGSVRWHGLLVCAVDGTTMSVPDSARNLAVYRKQAGSHGGSGYPLLRLVALVTCGTRTVIDAVFGPMSCGELDYARRLRRSLHAGMIVLLDRNFGAAALIGELAATEADLLVRLKAIASCQCCAVTVTGRSCHGSAPCRSCAARILD